jgi:hypothetical protein
MDRVTRRGAARRCRFTRRKNVEVLEWSWRWGIVNRIDTQFHQHSEHQERRKVDVPGEEIVSVLLLMGHLFPALARSTNPWEAQRQLQLCDVMVVRFCLG